MKTDCNEYLKISIKLTYIDHYQTLLQQGLPENEWIKEKSEIFNFRKVSQISAYDKVLIFPLSAITSNILA